MEEIHDVKLLKKLARQAEAKLPDHMTANPHYKAAYQQIARGTSLLWRLLEQSGSQEKPAEIA